ncbi:MAG: hypothetical protein KA765_13340 [Thermoflexales bacterium]|nr:hypothetical protein [Thermoflexales bacterium]
MATSLVLTSAIEPQDTAQVLSYHERRTVLTVTDMDGSQEWTVENAETEAFLDNRTAWPLAWSRDSKHLYFTHREGGNDGCFGTDDFYGTDLLRFSLADAQATSLVPSVGYWLALSPDESQLAYLNSDNLITTDLVVRNLVTGAERRTPVEERVQQPDSRATNLIWSPDGKAILYTVKLAVCGNGPPSHSIVRIEIDTLHRKVLIHEDARRFVTTKWDSSAKVTLQDKDGKQWWMNPTTGQVTEMQ